MTDRVSQMTAADSVLVVVDVQDKLLAVMPHGPELVRTVCFLLDAAAVMEVPCRATEQYPKGLGPTTAEIAGRFHGSLPAKTSFSCCGATGFLDELQKLGRRSIVLTGMETHVCIAQTAFDLLDAGFRVFVPVDGVMSQSALDHGAALRRLELAGAVPTTAEAIAFEWVRDAADPRFKAASKLVAGRSR